MADLSHTGGEFIDGTLTITGTDDNDNIVAYGTDDDVNINAGYGDDTIYATNGNNVINAGTGDDLIHFTNGTDTVNGGDGIDQAHFHYESIDSLSLYENNNGIITISTSNGSTTTYTNIERFSFGYDNFAITYTPQVLDMIYASSATFINGVSSDQDQTLNASDESTLILGGSGEDTINGGLNNDVIQGNQGDDLIGGGLGIDRLYGSLGNDTLFGGLGDDVLSGGDGNDAVHGEDGNDWLQGDEGKDTLFGGAGDDVLYASNSSILSGGDGRDTLYGGPGNDRLYSAGGSSNLFGEDGDDYIYTEDNDYIDGGSGIDTLNIIQTPGNLSSVFYLILDQTQKTLTSDGNFDSLQIQCNHRKDGDVIVYYQDKSVVVQNIEKLEAYGVSLTVDFSQNHMIDDANLLVNGIEHAPEEYEGPVEYLDYSFIGESTDENATGSNRNDIFNLKDGDDAANGGIGDDVLDGGAGSNFLTGGEGNDTFFLDGRDGDITWSTITDFNGDEVNIWGWNEGVSKILSSEDNTGAEGFKGATLHYDLNNDGSIDTSITFSGLALSEIPQSIASVIDDTGYLFFG